jgi:hypothetical protein
MILHTQLHIGSGIADPTLKYVWNLWMPVTFLKIENEFYVYSMIHSPKSKIYQIRHTLYVTCISYRDILLYYYYYYYITFHYVFICFLMLTCTVVFVLGCNWPYLAVVKHVNKLIELLLLILLLLFLLFSKECWVTGIQNSALFESEIEVLTVINVYCFWVVTPCSFAGTCHNHLQRKFKRYKGNNIRFCKA